jgi:Ca2+-binding RTX toxin-like protein
MFRRCLLMTSVLVALCAPAASAATIRADGYDACEGDPDGCPLVVSYDAAPGEINTVSVSAPGLDGSYVVSDSTAPLTAGENCIQVDPATVRCSVVGGNPLTFVGVWVRLGDGDDSLTAGAHATAFGDAGDDTLIGGPGRDAFVGGSGEDTLRGGDGDDSLDGDGGPADAYDDVLDGGGGTDQVTYRDRHLPVTASLAAGRGGAPGEQDSLVDVEKLEGGLRANTLTGDDGPNVLQTSTAATIRGSATLTGGGGNDRLFGSSRSDTITGGAGDDTLDGGIGIRPDQLSAGDGDDRITGSDGPDRISGGAGDDVIEPRLRYRLQKEGDYGDLIGCGEGLDSVDYPYPRALVRGSCERVTVIHARVERPRRVSSTVVEVPATFIKSRSSASPCALYIELRDPRTDVLLGRSQRLRWQKRAQVTFRIALTAAGVRRLRGGAAPLVVAWVNSLYSCMPPDRVREGFSLRIAAG